MSIFPKNFHDTLVYKWQIAQLNLPIPDKALNSQELQEWHKYTERLSPKDLIEKLSDALDQLHALSPQNGDYMSLNSKDMAIINTKWEATHSLASAAIDRFRIDLSYREEEKNFETDVSQGIFYVVELLKGVDSPHVKKWETHAQNHKQDFDQNKTFLSLLNKVDEEKRNASKKRKNTQKPR